MMKSALYTGVSVAGAFAVSYGIKYLTDRERPYIAYPDLIYPYSLEDSSSFPSAHTATAFALATSLSLEYPKWYVIAPSALWACSVGVSRMNEGVHYPSDVLAGAAIGAGCAVLNFYANRWLNRWLFGEQ
jgi:membrane-associated phospholipid phosphatase